MKRILLQLTLAVLAALVLGCNAHGLPGSTVGGCVVSTSASADSDPAETTFLALGDFGAREGGRNLEVAEALRSFLRDRDVHPDFALLLGDNFYPRGLIGSGTWCLPWREQTDDEAIARQLQEVVGPFSFLRSEITLHVIPGNHDYGCPHLGSLRNQESIDRWLPPDQAWGNRWETFSGLPREIVRSPLLQIVALDTTRMIHDADFLDASARRLEELLASSPARWRIIAGHHPLYANGHHGGVGLGGTVAKLLYYPSHLLVFPPFLYSGEATFERPHRRYRERLEGVFERERVDLFLAGHEHALEILDRARPGQPLTVISGTGARCEKITRGENQIFGASKNGFVAVSISPSRLGVEVIGTTGCDRAPSCARPETVGRWYALSRHSW